MDPMSSKYDDFWAALTTALRDTIEAARDRGQAHVALDGIRVHGDRGSWYGTAVVKGETVRQSSMAHMRSLARHVVDTGLCTYWPDTTFKFTCSADGSRLTVDMNATARLRRPSSPALREAELLPSTDAAETPVDVESTCVEIHQLVATLPLHRTPREVAFSNGLYFFYERGERSEHGPDGRIVRIGNHPRSQERLVGRLGDHYRFSAGAKNGSVFRRYLGGALIRQRDAGSTCLSPGPGAGHWEHQDEVACPDCAGVELDIRELLADRFSFRCVRVDDMSMRNRLEDRLIATIAACPTCRPSAGWLGQHAYPALVRSSGLWNTQHVGGAVLTARDMSLFRQAVSTSRTDQRESESLSETLLIIPCSSAKAGVEDPGLPVVQVMDLLGPASAALLAEGRELAFAKPATSLDPGSPLRPAVAYYTGQPYATEGVRDRLVAAIRRGLHCLIVSGGYGVVRAEEPIHRYEAHLPTQTRAVWARRLPEILRDYVAANGISRTITVVSSGYAALLPEDLTTNDTRLVPTFSRDTDSGSALRVVPERIGAHVADVLAAL
jgi:hypothetical protein